MRSSFLDGSHDGQPRVELVENIILSLKTENSQGEEDTGVKEIRHTPDRWEYVQDIIGEEWLVPPL